MDDGFNSNEEDSSEDEDYVPEAEDPESADSCDEELGVKSKKGSNARTEQYPRRRGGIRLQGDSDEDEASGSDSEQDSHEFESLEDLKRKNAEEKLKEKADILWKSFKADTNASTKPAEPSKIGNESASGDINKTPLVAKNSSGSNDVAKYSFAGEDVIITPARKQDASAVEEAAKDITNTPGKKQEPQKATIPGPSSKRSGLSSILGSISKKPKISTLEKSKLDWNIYKEDEGLDDELKSAKDSGYLDRQEFLQRADVRQFDLEKKARLSSMKFRK